MHGQTLRRLGLAATAVLLVGWVAQGCVGTPEAPDWVTEYEQDTFVPTPVEPDPDTTTTSPDTTPDPDTPPEPDTTPEPDAAPDTDSSEPDVGTDLCADVVCESLENLPCVDNIICNPENGACVTQNTPAEIPCNDGDAATRDDMCDGEGSCVGTAYNCDDEFITDCTPWYEPDGSGCVPQIADVGTGCDDQVATTHSDTCNGAGVCVGTGYNCDGQPITTCTLSYAPDGTGPDGCTPTFADNNTACGDGDLTTHSDTCDGAGVCVGTGYNCDGQPITTCTLSYAPDGTGPDGCTPTHATDDTKCDDDDLGTADDTCDGNGTCIGTAIVCEVGTCQTSSTPDGTTCAVEWMPPGDSCDDGSTDTKDDVCDGLGTCAGTPYTCAPAACQESSTADGTDCIVVLEPPGSACNDGDDNTKDDTCDIEGVCVGNFYDCPINQCVESASPDGEVCVNSNSPPGKPCDDEDDTTKDDACGEQGQCVGTPYGCDDEPLTDCITGYTQDGDGCVPVPAADETPCDDDDLTTSDDRCDGQGVCVGTAYTCEEETVTDCTPSFSQDGSGECTPNHAEVDKNCDDDDNTTRNDVCDGEGTCSGESYDCDEEPPITACRPSYEQDGVSCIAVNAESGTTCDDGDADTHGDICDGAGACRGAEYRFILSSHQAAVQFVMGSPIYEACRDEGETQHQVVLTTPFLIRSTEVTQADWEDLMGYNPSANEDCPDCPVESVSYYDALAYCNALSIRDGFEPCYDLTGCELGEGATSPGDDCYPDAVKDEEYVTPYLCEGYRLPTEAEWEYAVRGNAESYLTFHNGSLSGNQCFSSTPELNAIAWYEHTVNNLDGGIPAPQPVIGVKLPNAFGLYHMAGNVAEFVYDWYAAMDGTHQELNPTGPPTSVVYEVVVRGGHFQSYAGDLRSAARDGLNPETRTSHVGFRPVRSCLEEGDGCLQAGGPTCDYLNQMDPCDDGFKATQWDTCNAENACVGQPYECDDALDECIIEGEENGYGCDFVYAEMGTACDDFNPETKTDTCGVEGWCQGVEYTCDAVPCVDTFTKDGEGCIPETYTLADVSCDDGHPETKIDICDGLGGCTGTLYTCEKGPCEASSTPNGVGCDVQPKADGVECDDGDPTTMDDTCGAGTCIGMSYTCDDEPDFPTSTCTPSYSPDGEGCTPNHAASPTGCDDGDLETLDDVCDGEGTCAGMPYTCEKEQCQASSVANGTDCTIDHIGMLGTDCDDGNPATFDDACGDSGGCYGVPYECPPTTCAPEREPDGSGGCTVAVSAAEEVPCSDDDPTTKDDQCDGAGACAGTTYTCDDAGPCIVSSVPNGVDCTITGLGHDAPCDDGDPTTKNDICADSDSYLCQGESYTCDDSDPCVEASVPNGVDCTETHAPQGTGCDDGDPCTQPDACGPSGTCLGGSELDCGDTGNPCTVAQCYGGAPFNRSAMVLNGGSGMGETHLAIHPKNQTSESSCADLSAVDNVESNVFAFNRDDRSNVAQPPDSCLLNLECPGPQNCLYISNELDGYCAEPGDVPMTIAAWIRMEDVPTNATDAGCYACSNSPGFYTTKDECEDAGFSWGSKPHGFCDWSWPILSQGARAYTTNDNSCSGGTECCDQKQSENFIFGLRYDGSQPVLYFKVVDTDNRTNSGNGAASWESAEVPISTTDDPEDVEDTWLHVAVAYDGNGTGGSPALHGGTIKLYVNGQASDGEGMATPTYQQSEGADYERLRQSKALTRIGADGSHVIGYGGGSDWSGQYANGRIDDLIVMKAELDETRIGFLYGSGCAPDVTFMPFIAGADVHAFVALMGEPGIDTVGATTYTPWKATLDPISAADHGPIVTRLTGDWGYGGASGEMTATGVCGLAEEDSPCVTTDVDAGTSCDDLNLETKSDACDGEGLCVGESILCSVGECIVTADPNGEACDYSFKAVGVGCDDFDDGTRDDACTADGQCVGEPYDCPAPDECTVGYFKDGEECIPLFVSAETNKACSNDDTSPCAPGVCDGTGQCVPQPIDCAGWDIDFEDCATFECIEGQCMSIAEPDGWYCNDFDSCTDGDVCMAGFCTGWPKVCEASNTCSVAECDDGVCVESPNNAVDFMPCDDGLSCTSTALCDNGTCTPGEIDLCEDRLISLGVETRELLDVFIRDSGDAEEGDAQTLWFGELDEEDLSFHLFWRAMRPTEALESRWHAVSPADLGLYAGWHDFNATVVATTPGADLVESGQIEVAAVPLAGGGFAVIAAEFAAHSFHAGLHWFEGGPMNGSVCHAGVGFSGDGPCSDDIVCSSGADPYCVQTNTEDVNAQLVDCPCACSLDIRSVEAVRIGQVTLTRFDANGKREGAPVRLLGQSPDVRDDRFSCDFDEPTPVFLEGEFPSFNLTAAATTEDTIQISLEWPAFDITAATTEEPQSLVYQTVTVDMSDPTSPEIIATENLTGEDNYTHRAMAPAMDGFVEAFVTTDAAHETYTVHSRVKAPSHVFGDDISLVAATDKQVRCLATAGQASGTYHAVVWTEAEGADGGGPPINEVRLCVRLGDISKNTITVSAPGTFNPTANVALFDTHEGVVVVLVIWRSDGVDGTEQGDIYGAWYRVNTETGLMVEHVPAKRLPIDNSGGESKPTVAIADGVATVTWQRGEDIFTRRFDHNGHAIAPPLETNRFAEIEDGDMLFEAPAVTLLHGNAGLLVSRVRVLHDNALCDSDADCTDGSTCLTAQGRCLKPEAGLAIQFSSDLEAGVFSTPEPQGGTTSGSLPVYAIGAPEVAVAGDGGGLIVWGDTQGWLAGPIHGLAVSPDSDPSLGTPFWISNTPSGIPTGTIEYGPSVAGFGTAEWAVAWTRSGAGSPTRQAQAKCFSANVYTEDIPDDYVALEPTDDALGSDGTSEHPRLAGGLDSGAVAAVWLHSYGGTTSLRTAVLNSDCSHRFPPGPALSGSEIGGGAVIGSIPPAIAALPGVGYVIAGIVTKNTSQQVWVATFTEEAVEINSAQQFSLYEGANLSNLSVASSFASVDGVSTGGGLVTWEAEDLDGDEGTIVARHISPYGDPIGLPWIANLTFDGHQTDPTATIRGDGTVRIYWQNLASSGFSTIVSRRQSP